MQRERFTISCNGQSVIKFKWNAARRETVNLVREIARAERVVYNRTGGTAIKEGFNFVRGSETWTGGNGNVVHFTIEKTR